MEGPVVTKLNLDERIVTNELQHDLDKLGIAKTAQEEKKRARDAKLSEAENARMARMYREHVLGEKKPEGFIPLTTLAASANGNGNGSKPVSKTQGEPVLGD